MSARLERLAGLCDIALEYHDIWGQRRRASASTLVALLDAMGIRAQDDAAIEAAIAACESARWSSVVAPAIVGAADETPWRVRLNLPAAADGDSLHWLIEEEAGRRHSGRFVPEALEAVERATIDGRAYVARELALPVALTPGYHRLAILRADAALGASTVVAAPRRCYLPPALEGKGRTWGAAVQLYGLRSDRNWGIGDYTDLATLVEQWGRRGGGIVGVNPLHALFPHDPARASPYAPSSRLFKNVLCIDVEAVADFRECDPARALVRSAPFQTQLKALRDAELVDYPLAAALKFQVLELLFAHFRAQHLSAGTVRAREFRGFRGERGEALRRHALFEALQEHLHHNDPSIWGWPAWPQAYRDAASPACAAFAAEHADRLEFFEYLQWQADVQLAAAGRRSFEMGLDVGLCEDLAVSIDRGGAEAWATQGLYALGASVGAPPDDFCPSGQDWGLPPMVPAHLRAAAFAPFIATLRSNMRHAGALRIDHVMGLARLFWVPAGRVAVDGAYVRYPFAELLGILALESQRNRCLVIGEDLGTVPDEVRTALAAAGVFSYRLLYFERQPSGDFKAPAEHPEQALVAATTHDLPTLGGWWAGHDLAVRANLGLLPNAEERHAQVIARAQDRARLLLALEREGLLPAGATVNPVSVPEMTPELALAIAIYLGRSGAQVLLVQLEDVLGVRDQANVPGTTTEHPNWRRRLPLALERWPEDERFVGLTGALARLRRRAARPIAPVRAASAAIVPRATYRLQLHRDFTFAAATTLLPYLAELGVSHVYCSPYLRARPGSRHGYDIVDHSALNPEIGNRDDFERFVATLAAHGMGHIADVVPNHMGIMGADNAWWMDVLENGPASAYAGYFDVDWNPVDPSLAGKVLVPVLGDHYGSALERGELVLTYEPQAGGFAIWYHEHRFPVDPREYPRILQPVPGLLRPDALSAEGAADFASLIAAFGHLPAREATDSDAVAERSRDKEVHKSRLGRLVRQVPALAEAVDRAVRAINGTVGTRETFKELDELLEAQAYRLAYWRAAADDVNYRRFFDIVDLAALRMEDESVFEATHRFVLELAAEGKLDGLRIDHADGLFDPAEYFRRLQQRYSQLTRNAAPPVDAEARPLYVVAEKILARHEHLPPSWPVFGTTGYRFANLVNGLFVDAAAKSRISRSWRAFVGNEALEFDEAVYRSKRAIMRSSLAGELSVLANRLLHIARADWRTRDFTFNSLRLAIAEIVACFPVYRTYLDGGISAQDRRCIDWAVARAKRRSTIADLSAFDFLRSVLLDRSPSGASAASEADCREFTMHFQQFTAPVAAKGVEDTACYVFNRLVSLNDVGDDPDSFGVSVATFHADSTARAERWPHTMLATSTHDSKRSEDVRLRIDVIAERPAAWRLAVRRWSRANRAHKRSVDGQEAPSRNDEYLFYQTLVGTFPAGDVGAPALAAYCERIERYLLKAVREAKTRTSWINPNSDYEAAVTEFVRASLAQRDDNPFLEDLRAQAPTFAWFGALNGLSLAIIKFGSPGVPDIYQGEEGIALALVDPDNRRPVDYAWRKRTLASFRPLVDAGPEERLARLRELLEGVDDGRAKLWVIWRALALRRDWRKLFDEGSYEPIAATGARARNVVAFARRLASAGVIVVAGRLFASLGLDVGVPPLDALAWGDTSLDLSFVPPGTPLRNVLTGETQIAGDGTLRVAEAFRHFPGAIFTYGQHHA